MPPEEDITEDRLMGGRIALRQSRRGYRAGADAALLAAAVEAATGERIAAWSSAAPGPQPASITRSPVAASTAAASRAASAPAR